MVFFFLSSPRLSSCLFSFSLFFFLFFLTFLIRCSVTCLLNFHLPTVSFPFLKRFYFCPLFFHFSYSCMILMKFLWLFPVSTALFHLCILFLTFSGFFFPFKSSVIWRDLCIVDLQMPKIIWKTLYEHGKKCTTLYYIDFIF